MILYCFLVEKFDSLGDENIVGLLVFKFYKKKLNLFNFRCKEFKIQNAINFYLRQKKIELLI